MLLSEILAALRIELQDLDEDSYVHSEDDLSRAVRKCVSLMSRLIPDRGMVETTIVRAITGETLTIATDTGTLTYKPIKPDSLSIPNKTVDTDYTVNYLTGVVTEVGSNLPDTDYTVSYELDSQMLDISSLLSDYIKIDRMEYPAGEYPVANPTYDVLGDFIRLRGNTNTLTAGKHLRLMYLKRWTPATETVRGSYPTHLNDAIIIGSAGQALIFKAEKHTQAAVTAIAAGKVLLDAIAAVTVATAPSISTEITAAQTALAAGIARFVSAVTAVGNMDTPLGASVTALDKVGAVVVTGVGYLTTGAAKINAATRGDKVGEIYGAYGSHQAGLAQTYDREGAQRTALALGWEAKSGRETTIGNSYLNEGVQRLAVVARLLEKYRLELEGNSQDVAYYARQLDRITKYETTAKQLIEISGRFLASGQAKINEMLIMLGLKPEYSTQRASSGQPS